MLLLPQRMQLAAEFVESLVARDWRSGVLLSGPNGVGKSGVGLLAYLLCAARRLPVVYLSGTETWVVAAQSGDGDAHLLKRFWRQNADLIAASEPLRRVFAAALRDEPLAFDSAVMEKLREVAGKVGVGVILDEVQHITAAVQRGLLSEPSSPAFTSAFYFRHTWHDWMNDNAVFVRMSIASAHGERDYKLPSGEEHRLRIVEPLADRQRSALQSHPASPAYVHHSAARERIVFYTGNILRSLSVVARGLPTTSSPELEAVLAVRLERLHTTMQLDCERWLTSLPEGERTMAAERAKELLAGKLSWRTAKGLYDAGIMFRTAASDCIRPVSAIAASIYLSSVAKLILRTGATPLSSIADGRRRGFELEARVLARLSEGSFEPPAKLLDGRRSDPLSLRSSYALPFDQLEEVVPRSSPVLYQPQSLTHQCDGIVMPASGAKDAIVVLECSTQSPRLPERVGKVLKYLRPGGVVSKLAQRYPFLPCVVALVYDGDLAEAAVHGDTGALCRGELPSEQRAASGGPTAVAATAASTVPTVAALPPAAMATVRVLDRGSLISLGYIAL